MGFLLWICWVKLIIILLTHLFMLYLSTPHFNLIKLRDFSNLWIRLNFLWHQVHLCNYNNLVQNTDLQNPFLNICACDPLINLSGYTNIVHFCTSSNDANVIGTRQVNFVLYLKFTWCRSISPGSMISTGTFTMTLFHSSNLASLWKIARERNLTEEIDADGDIIERFWRVLTIIYLWTGRRSAVLLCHIFIRFLLHCRISLLLLSSSAFWSFIFDFSIWD